MNTQSHFGAACRSIVQVKASVTILFVAALIAAGLCTGAYSQVRKGNVFIPASSIEQPQDIGVRAHTNIEILVGPPGRGARPGGGLGPGGGLSPDQLRQAYNLPSTGGSQIIAVVDAFDDPNALNDFNVFASQFGLPVETSSDVTASTNQVFQVVYAGKTQPIADSSGSWELEEALDIQWAHAMAPNAKIILFECSSNSNSDLLAGVDAATNYIDANGLTAKEISNSWGESEFSGEAGFDNHFSGTSAVYFACAGDDAAPAWWPSVSPYMIAAGGTTISTDSNGNFTGEAGWADGGGGPAAGELMPTYQNVISAIVMGARGTPDISYEADPNTGVAVYDTFMAGGWIIVGGTSVSSPSLAGIANLAGTAKGAFPAGSLILLNTIYSNLGTTNFRDITTGNNGYAAGVGWDFVTGVGSCLGLGGLTPAGTLIAYSLNIAVSIGASTPLTLTGKDPEFPPQPISFAIARRPLNGTLTGLNTATGAVTYTPNGKFKGADSFLFTVSTTSNTSAAALVSITVGTGTPTANPQTVAVPLGAATSIVLTGSDPDVPPLPLTFAIATLPAHGTLTNHNTSTGDVTYTPGKGFGGQDSFTFAVSNGVNYSGIATVTLNVAPGTPTANYQTIAVAHNTPAKVTLSASDPDNPPLPLKYAIASSPTHGSLSGFNATTGAVTYIPNANTYGTDNFTFTVNNGTNTSAIAAVTLNVAAGIPTANSQTVGAAHNTAAKVTLSGSDTDSPALPLTFAVGSPTHGSLSGLNTATGAVIYTPNTNFQGADSFTFTVSNGSNSSAVATVSVKVAAGKPTANAQSAAVAHNTATKITLTGTDTDNPALALKFAISGSPTHGSLSGLNTATGAVTYTPSANYHGTDAFTFTVSNGVNTSAAATVTLKVAPGTPTANAQTVSVVLNTKTTIKLAGSDPDVPALALTFAVASNPAHGVLSAVNVTTGIVTYTPVSGFKGADSFTFTVSNGTNKSAPAKVTLVVDGG